MDIKEKIEEVVSKVQKDKDLQALFAKDPVKAVEKVLGVDLPDDVVKKIADGVKGKISLDQLSGLADKVKGLF